MQDFNANETNLLICGNGSGAHAFAGIASSLPGTRVQILSIYKDKAERWNDAIRTSDLVVTRPGLGVKHSEIRSRPDYITDKPEEVVGNADLIVFILPAFALQNFLERIERFIVPGATIVGLPGAVGFEFEVERILGEKASQCTIMNFESLPWACRTTVHGKRCEVLGTKETLYGAMHLGSRARQTNPVSTLQSLLGDEPKLIVSGPLVAVSLMSTNAYLHTAIMYGEWCGWSGKQLKEAPLFYNGLSKGSAQLLADMSDEVVAVAKAIAREEENVDMSEVVPIYQWYMRCYPGSIENNANLYTAIRTNAGYRGLRHPTTKTLDGKFLPDFTHRYLTEDIPFGLVVLHGIAEIAGVKTPNIDRVITWAQGEMGKEFLAGSQLSGGDVKFTRAPQNYGIATVADLLR